MPRELSDNYADVNPTARNPPCPQQLHYYNERRHPRGAYFANRFERSDIGAPYYSHESWSSGRRPEFEYGPGSPFVRETYCAGVVTYHSQRNDYRRRDAEGTYFRSPDGTRDDSVEREHGERKRRHHKSSKHRHRRSRHHRRHKRSRHSEKDSDDEGGNDLPSLTLGAEISRGRRHGISPVTRTSAPESDISDDGSESVRLPSDSIGASVRLSLSLSAVPVAYSSCGVENDRDKVVVEPAVSLENKQQSIEESDEGSISDGESSTKKSQSSTSSSETESSSPTAAKCKTKIPQVTKVRSSYATALAAKLRQNRLALEERSCRRPDTNTAKLQPSDESPSVIDKSSVNTETSRLCSESDIFTNNGLNVDRVMTANKELEISSRNVAISCSAPVQVKSSTQVSVSQFAALREVHSTTSLNWYATKLFCYFFI